MTKYTERQQEAINALKAIEKQLKGIAKYAPDPNNYPDKKSYNRAVNAANKQYWKDTLGATEGVTIGEVAKRLNDKKKELIYIMGRKSLSPGFQASQVGLSALTDEEKIPANTLHIGVGPAKFRRKFPLLKISKGGNNQWDNPFYVYKYDKAATSRDDKELKTARQDYLRSTDTTGMNQTQIDNEINQSLSNWNYHKVGGINYEDPLKGDPKGKEAKTIKLNSGGSDNKMIQTSTGSYSTKRSGRNKLTLGKDDWLAETANSPAASFLDPDERWNQQLNHREWLRINNRL